MIVHEISSAPGPLINVLLWDEIESEWRIGHKRRFADVGEDFWCSCTVAEAAELITDGEPVPVFTEVSHWSPLPPPMDAK